MRIPHSDRERAIATRGAFLFHLRPLRVSRQAVRWAHSFGLDGSALVLWLTLTFYTYHTELYRSPRRPGAMPAYPLGALSALAAFGEKMIQNPTGREYRTRTLALNGDLDWSSVPMRRSTPSGSSSIK